MDVAVQEVTLLKVEYINPFIESVQNVFSKMLDSEAKRGAVSATHEDSESEKMTVAIGMSGIAQGMVALVLSRSTALAIVNRMLGTDSEMPDACRSQIIVRVDAIEVTAPA